MPLVFEINTGDFVKNLVGQFRAMRDAAFYSIDEGADVFIEEMQRRIESNTPSGRVYHFRFAQGFQLSRYGPTKEGAGRTPHIASAPGETPAVLSGKLLRSFRKHTIFSRGHTRIIAYIINTQKYAEYLEYGTMSTGWGGPMAPRPFMAPVMYSARINHRMGLRVAKAMARAGQAYGARF